MNDEQFTMLMRHLEIIADRALISCSFLSVIIGIILGIWVGSQLK